MKRTLLCKAHQRRRSRKQARAHRTHPRRALRRRRRFYHAAQVAVRLAAHRKEPVFDATVCAPSKLSFVEAPSLVIDFLKRLRAACQPKRTIVADLSRVTHLSNCALLLLQSKLQEGSPFIRRADVYIRTPQNAAAAKVWQESFVKPLKTGTAYPSDQVLILHRQRFHKKAEVEIADILVRRAMRYLTGEEQDHHACYRALVECMANTFQHADPKTEANENWWVASYPHPDPDSDGVKRWCFAFVDNGVGILQSLKIKRFSHRLQQLLGLLPNIKMLQMLMAGEIGSRLGLSYRGKGLPGIHKELVRGRIRNLVIVANDAHANFATQEFVSLTQPFGGTFLYWELTLPPQP